MTKQFSPKQNRHWYHLHFDDAPFYLPLITDRGDITSHTAIVSREFGVPCIIGTKIATKVFADGDLVEVNANHNWARKISS